MATYNFTIGDDTLIGGAGNDVFQVVFDRYAWDGVPAGYTASAEYQDGMGFISPNAGLTGPVNGTATDAEIQAADVINGGAGSDALWAGAASMSTAPMYTKDFDFRPVTITSIEQLWFSYMIMPMPGSARFNSNQFGAGMSNNMTVRGAWGGTDIIVDLVAGANDFSAAGWTFTQGGTGLTYVASLNVNGVTWFNVPRAGGGAGAYNWGPFVYSTYNSEVGYGMMGDDMGGDFFHEDRVILNGSTGADTITGSVMYDIINAGDGNDVVNAGHGVGDIQGADDVDGGAGTDTLVFTKNFADYTFSKTGDVITFSEISGANPTTFAYTAAYNSVDSTNFEIFQFADGTKTLADLGYGGDTTPPSVTINSTIATDTGATGTIASGGVTKDATLGLSGTAGDNVGVASVEIFDGTTSLGMATLSGGNWSFTTGALSDGAHSLTAVAADAAGNTTTSSAISVTIDTTAPAVAITSTGGLTNDATQTVTGTGEVGATITLMDGMTSVGTTTVGAGGTWSIAADLGATQGVHSLMAHATDAAGNMGMSNTVAYTLDTVAPAVAITSVGGNVVDPAQTVTGTGEAGTLVTVYEGMTALGSTTVAGDGTWSVGVTLSGLGTHTLTAQQTDAAGNTGTSAAVNYNLGAADTTPPERPVITGTADGVSGASGPQWIVNGVAEAGSTVNIWRDVSGVQTLVGTGTADASGAFSVQTTANQHGLRILSATATDAAGNVSPASLLYYQGGHHGDTITLVDQSSLAGISKIDGHHQETATATGDTLVFSSATTLTDADFANVVDVENLKLTGASSVTLGANALAAGIGGQYQYVEADPLAVAYGKIVTGTGNTSITDSNAHTLNVDAALLAAGSTLTLAGAANFVATGGVNGDAIDASASTGANTLNGGDGDDVLKGGSGADMIDGGAGSDTVDYTGVTNNLTVRLQAVRANPDSTGHGVPGDYTVGGASTVVVAGGTNDTLYGVENVTGGSGNDMLMGDGAVNVLRGGLGNDGLVANRQVYIQAGDVFDGGDGVDTLWAGKTMTDIDYGSDPVSRLDFSAATLQNIERFAFNYMPMPMPGTATFSSSQFGAGLMSNNLAVYGAWGDNDITVNLTSGDSSFDASGWTFPTGTHATGMESYVWGRYTLASNLGMGKAGMEVGGLDTIHLMGSSGNNAITGTIVDDIIIGNGGNDAIDGNAGVDTAVFSGDWSDYSISEAGGVYTIVDNRAGSPDGTDTVTEVEMFQFGNATYTAAQLLSGDLTAPNLTITSAGG